jgi:choline transport protein
MVQAMIIFNNEDYSPKRWHTAMWMWFFILLPLLLNLQFKKVMTTIETIGAVGHYVFFVANIITLGVMAQRSPTSFVFKTLTHSSPGWSNPAVAFGIGLITTGFSLSG